MILSLANGNSPSANVPSGLATTRGPSGEILIYQIDFVRNEDGTLELNTLWTTNRGEGSPDLGSWASNVHQKTLDASNPKCYSWNVTIPAGLQAGTSFFAPFAKSLLSDRIMSIFFNQT